MDRPHRTGRRRGLDARSGHPEISWSICLEVVLDRPVRVDEARSRLQDGWPRDAAIGPVPKVEARAQIGELVEDFANRPYRMGEPLCRVCVAEDQGTVLVAGHHAVVDGIGLLALLGLVSGHRVTTSVRGLGQEVPSRSAGIGYVARRVLEALLAPPARAEGTAHGRADGDLLLARSVPAMQATTAELVSGVARAIRAWNDGRGIRTRRLVVAVGASRRPGHQVELTERSAWYRLRVDRPAPAEIRDLLRGRAPEPPFDTLPGPARRAAGLLARRTGSTALVSNLGRLEAPVRTAALYPSAHGRSGLAFGCATATDATTFTVRARRSDFSREEAADLLDMVVGFVAGSERFDPGTL